MAGKLEAYPTWRKLDGPFYEICGQTLALPLVSTLFLRFGSNVFSVHRYLHIADVCLDILSAFVDVQGFSARERQQRRN